jgi:two-component system, OmpR family, aerobic respiration control sensor histidine kinase ArcB
VLKFFLKFLQKNRTENSPEPDYLINKLIENIPGHIYWKNKQGKYLGCNVEQAKSVGYTSPMEVIGKTDYEMKPKEEADALTRLDKKVMSMNHSIVTEEFSISKSGERLTYLSNKVPLLDDRNNCLGILGVSLDITEKKKLEDELKNTILKLENANTVKSEFIANMSHDLRTPMTGLLGMLNGLIFAAEDARASLNSSNNNANFEAVLKDVLDKVEISASIAKESATNLNQLHNDILDNIELESGESKETVTSFNLDQLIQSVIALQKPVAIDKKLSLTAEIDEATPCNLKGLRQSLSRTLLNLISNGLKFTEHGSVSVSVGLADSQETTDFQPGDTVTLKVQVKDTGIGIPEDKHDEIFGHFSRLSSSYEGIHKGLGLGLYVVKNYIDTMEGEISLESTLNEGSCFTLLLPLTIEKTGTTRLSTPTSNENTTDVSTQRKTEGTKERYVLLVEDAPIAAMATRVNLTHLGCEIDIAKSGEEALEKIENQDYHIIFMDIGLPGKSGIDVAREIRQNNDPDKGCTPIIALTGHARGKSRKLCLDAGMQSVLSKPADIDDLKKALDYFA